MSSIGKSDEEKFELSLPFYRMRIHVYVAKVKAAHLKAEKKGFVNLADLREQFDS